MQRLSWIFVVTLLWLFVAPAWGADSEKADAFPLEAAFTAMTAFNDLLYGRIDRALASGTIRDVVNVLFLALATGLFVWKFAGFAMRGFDMLDIVELMLTIVFVYVLLTGYTRIFPAIISGTQFVGDQIGIGIAGTPPEGSLAKSLMVKLAGYFFKPVCSGLECVSSKAGAMIGALIAMVSALLLGIVALLVELWCSWGFAIAYAIGWVTIPFLMYERLQFLFDGWLKFFFGMGVYAIVAKANLALVFVSLQLFSGTFVPGTPQVTKDAPALVDGLSDIAGLLVFVFVGIYSLFSTNRFAQAIVMGAGGGGMGGMVQSAAKAGKDAVGGGRKR